MSDVIMTGERYIPESNDLELEIEHLERYYTASRYVEGKIVLDAACGEGYGSHILAQTAKSVIGVDLDIDAVTNAQKKYSDLNNLQYVQGSIEKLDFIEDNTIDVVVSFETIEHVPEDIQRKFISEIYRVLKKDGILIMSSPNKKEYTDRYNFHNKFHVHELYVEEFVELLKTKFKNINLYRQYLEVASFIDRADIDEDIIQYHKNRDKYNPEGKYVIAVAGNEKLPEKSLSIASLHLREEYLSTLDELNYCRAEAIKCRNIIKEMEEKLQQENELNSALKNEFKLSKEELERRAIELESRMSLINNLKHENDILENNKKLVDEELNRRAVELENRMNVINDLRNELNLKHEELNQCISKKEDCMRCINELQKEKEEMKWYMNWLEKRGIMKFLRKKREKSIL